jgi:hypothetical protein
MIITGQNGKLNKIIPVIGTPNENIKYIRKFIIPNILALNNSFCDE